MVDTPSTQTTISKVELPPFIEEAAKKNLKIADQLAQRPYEAYTGPLTADLSDLQKAANQQALANSTQWNPAFQSAINTAQGVAGAQTPTFAGSDLSPYMNPYLDEVEKRALDNTQRSLTNTLNTIGDSAIAAGAFGGSRHGVAEGVAAAEAARAMGDLSAQLRAQGFETASGLLNQDLNRTLQNRALQLESASTLGGLASAGSEAGLKNATLLGALGEQQRAVEQQKLQEQYAKWQDERNYPLQQLNLRLAALGATPYGSTQTQQTTGGGGGANTALQLAGGIISVLPFLFMSDKREKTDIEKLGKDPETGLTMYAYRYKGDPKSYPKVVGPMAQEIERKYPGAVTEIGGKKVVRNLGLGV